MNGAALPQPHGFPLRLIAPGWYGIANVKWLKRIEVLDTRFMGRFMARDYVTIREEQRNGETEAVETSVGRTLLKSAPGKVTRKDGQYRIVGAAWGAPIARVEVQIDGGPWRPATIDRSEQAKFAWSFWSIDWTNAAPGEHRSHREPSIGKAMCSRRWTIPASPGRRPTGRATARSRGGFALRSTCSRSGWDVSIIRESR